MNQPRPRAVKVEKVVKVDGKENPADMFTKALGAQVLEGHLKRLNFVY